MMSRKNISSCLSHISAHITKVLSPAPGCMALQIVGAHGPRRSSAARPRDPAGVTTEQPGDISLTLIPKIQGPVQLDFFTSTWLSRVSRKFRLVKFALLLYFASGHITAWLQSGRIPTPRCTRCERQSTEGPPARSRDVSSARITGAISAIRTPWGLDADIRAALFSLCCIISSPDISRGMASIRTFLELPHIVTSCVLFVQLWRMKDQLAGHMLQVQRILEMHVPLGVPGIRTASLLNSPEIYL